MTSKFTIAAQRNLAVTVQEAWALTADTSRYADWVTSVRAVHTHHGAARVGEDYTETVGTIGPLTTHARWTVRVCDPLRLRVDSGEGFAPLSEVVNTFRFTPLPGGTGVSMTYEYSFVLRPRFAGALVRRLLEPGMRRDFDRAMQNLESVILSERAAHDLSGEERE